MIQVKVILNVHLKFPILADCSMIFSFLVGLIWIDVVIGVSIKFLKFNFYQYFKNVVIGKRYMHQVKANRAHP